MSPTTRRRILLASLVVVSGCAAFAPKPYYTWEPDPKWPACKTYVWKQYPRSYMPGLCMGADGRQATEDTSCAAGCVIFSPFSEAEAKRVFDHDGTSIYDHELRHALKGERHPHR